MSETDGGKGAVGWWVRFEHSLEVGLSFGLVSGAITTLGLVVGLMVGTQSRLAVVGGIVTIAVADSLSDALGIHMAEEAEGVHTTGEIWVATVATAATKFAMALSFLVPVLLLDLDDAVTVAVVWGLSAVTALTWWLTRDQPGSTGRAIAEHLLVTVVVVAASAGVGRWVAVTFG